MRPVRVRKDNLLTKLKTNRELHRTIFDEAVEGFRIEAVQDLENVINRIKRGKVSSVSVHRPAPVDHTKDYDNAIAMVEMEVNATLEIDEDGFNKYVMDDWTWKREFVSTATLYNSATSAKNYGNGDDDD